MKTSYIYSGPQVLIQRQHESDPNFYDEYFYLQDRLGSVRQVVDSSGIVVNTYTYNPFGQDFATEVSETVDNPFKFTGQYYDPEINQYYLRARQYDPTLMRFTSIDPVKGKFQQPLTLHRYLYCANDSINFTDPSGEFFGTLIGAFIGTTLSDALRNTEHAYIAKAGSVALGAVIDIAAALHTFVWGYEKIEEMSKEDSRRSVEGDDAVDQFMDWFMGNG